MAHRPEHGPARPDLESPEPPATRRSFSEGFGFGAASFGVGAAVGILSTIVVARVYGVEVIGEFALAGAPVGVVWFASTFQEVPALMRALATLRPRDPRVTALFAAVFAFSSALTAAVCAIGAIATVLLFNGPIDRPDLVVPALAQLAIYVVLVNTAWLLDAVFASFRSGRELFWIRLNQAVAYLGLAIGLSFLEESVWSLIAALGLSFVPSLAHRLIAVRSWMRFRIARAELRQGFSELGDLVRFGLKLTPGRIAEGVSGELGTWVLGATASIGAVGAWNRAWLLGKRVQDLNNRFGEMLLPTLVEREASGDDAGFDRAMLDSMRYVAVGLLLPAAVVGGAAHSVMALFGPGFDRASDALIAVMVALPAASLLLLQRQALLALDRPWQASWFGLLRLGVTAAVMVPAAVEWGITGAGVALLAGCLAQLGAQTLALRPHLSASAGALWPRRSVLALAMAYACGFVVARLLDVAIADLWALPVAIPAGAAAYLAALFAFGGVLPRDRSRISAILTSLRARGSRAGARPVAGTGPVNHATNVSRPPL